MGGNGKRNHVKMAYGCIGVFKLLMKPGGFGKGIDGSNAPKSLS